MNALLLAFGFVLPYHVMRTATAAGIKVHVLGAGPARGLKWSRDCASYRASRCLPDDPAPDLVRDELAALVRRYDIDVVLPSDDVSTRLLAEIQDDLPAPTSLLPDLPTFDLLNHKWHFSQFCFDHRVRTPPVWLYDDAAALRAALDSGRLRLPVSVKPISRSGGIGVVHLLERADLARLAEIEYRPVLAQRYVFGRQIGINIVCRDGEVLAQAAQWRNERRFVLFEDRDLLANVERLVAATRFTGAANLDSILEQRSGLNYVIECNPRFWYTIQHAMILGMNFVEAAVHRHPIPTVTGEVRLPPSDILRDARQASRFDWRMLRYHLRDPLPYLFQRRRTFDDRDVWLRPEQMTAYEPPAPALRMRG